MSEWHDDTEIPHDEETPWAKWVSRCYLNPEYADDDTLNDLNEYHFFNEWDGRWSSQTQELMSSTKASGLALNSNWAMTRTSWKCPICGRSKPQIAFRRRDGVLMAHLVEHHDHIDEYVKQHAKEIRSDIGRQVLLERHDAIVKLAQRFERITICVQCNEADGKAKARHSLPSHFTFTPQEIARFVIVSKSNEIEIDYEMAKSIYDDLAQGLETRAQFVISILKSIESGAWNYDGEDAIRRHDLWVQSRARLTAPSLELRKLATSSEAPLRFKMILRSTQQDHISVSQSIEVRVPTENVFSDLATRYPGWAKVPDSWHCPGCRRSKRDTVRLSNKGKWTGLIYDRCDFIETPNNYMQPHRYHLCHDCDVMRQDVQKQLCADNIVLHASDIRAIVTEATPHRLHVFNVDVAKTVALSRQKMYSDKEILVSEANSFYYYSRSISEHASETGRTEEEALLSWHEKSGYLIFPDRHAFARFKEFHLECRMSDEEIEALWRHDPPALT